jgi:hypothetical protein
MKEAGVGGDMVMQKMHSVAYRATLIQCTFPISSQFSEDLSTLSIFNKNVVSRGNRIYSNARRGFSIKFGA